MKLRNIIVLLFLLCFFYTSRAQDLSGFKAYFNEDHVFLEWVEPSSLGLDAFLIQRSADGKHFHSLGELDIIKKEGMPIDYLYVDTDGKELKTDTLCYRLWGKVEGRKAYMLGEVSLFKHELPEVSLSVYPNPIHSGETLFIKVESNGAIGLSLFDPFGRNVLNQLINQEETGPLIQLAIPDWNDGLYTLVCQVNGKQLRRKLWLR